MIFDKASENFSEAFFICKSFYMFAGSKHTNMETKSNQNEEKVGTAPLPIYVGQVLYRESLRRGELHKIVKVTVSKVGKKYFYLTGSEERYPIDKETLRYIDKNYNHYNFQLYRDKQEMLDLRERERLIDALSKHFFLLGDYRKNTIEQLKKAAEALGLS